jgi:hypothetical protein
MDMNIYTKRPALSPDHTEPGWDHRCVRPLDRMKKKRRAKKQTDKVVVCGFSGKIKTLHGIL